MQENLEDITHDDLAVCPKVVLDDQDVLHALDVRLFDLGSRDTKMPQIKFFGGASTLGNLCRKGVLVGLFLLAELKEG
jgi:hypothetical protein